MESEVRKAYDASRSIARKPFETACYAPYGSLYFNTNGDVIACCKNTSYVLGNVANDRLDEIWRGRRVRALRKALDRYRFGLGCEFCEWQIEAGQHDQVYAVTMFDSLPVKSAEPEWPAMMEFAVSNTCNLACIMCYGELSSTIRAHREHLPPLPKVYDDRFFEDLRRYLPHLQRANFLGGEPFLAQECHRIWDMMIEEGVAIPCRVTTNGTQWNARVERVLEAFPVSISLSLDGVTKETVESIRVNAHFETLLENTKRFRRYVKKRKTSMTLTYCLMRQNWHEFGEYLRFGEKLRLPVFINTVVDPAHTSLYTLAPDELLEIVAQMEEQDRSRRYSRLRRNGAQWRSALAALKGNANARQLAALDGVKEAARQRREATRRDHISRAWELAAAGSLDEALEEIRRIAEDHPRAHEALNVQAHLLRQMRRFGEAAEVLDHALTRWRKSPRTWAERARLRLDQGELGQGLVDARRARELLRESDDVATRAEVHYLVAQLCNRTARPEEALAELALATPVADPYDVAILRAQAYRQLGRMAESAEALRDALALRDDDAQAWVDRAWLYLEEDRAEEALAAARRACELVDSESETERAAWSFHVLSATHERLGDLAAALASAGTALACRPAEPALLVHRARLFQAAGRHREMLDDATAALDVYPEDTAANALVVRAKEELAS